MIQLDRKYFINFDWYLFLILLLISTIGILTIYSGTRPVLSNIQPNYYIKQTVWLLVGIFFLLLFILFDYQWLKILAYPIYLSGIALLLLVHFIGHGTVETQRWISLGFVSFQPTEIFKVILIIAHSRYLCNIKGNLTRFSFAFSFLVFGILPFILVIKQPDLGTGLILMFLFFSMALIKGIEKRFMILLIVFSIILIPVLGKLAWKEMKGYQKNRILAFIDPDADPHGIGYQIEQSKVSIGSGMIFGKGYLQGTQGPLRFLPEKHTDFIFSVFAEEWGFIGSVVIFFLYFILLLRGIDTTVKAKDAFGRYISIGITCMFFAYFTINIGMVVGMLPVVGKPIPFMSYGGTSLITNFIAAGILINVRMRRLGLFY